MTTAETRLRERLRNVEDPALDGDIVSLGLIEDIRIVDDTAEISLAFNAPYATDEMAMGDRIREVCSELGLEASLSVSLSWQDADSPLPDVRNIIAVSSGKGGVGKTTVATNLATALSEAGARVGLLDGDIYGPNVPSMIGVDGEPGLTDDETLVPPEAYGVKLISMGFLAQENTDPAMLRGPMIDNILTQLIEHVEWGDLDYLVVDLPPGTGDAQLTLLQTVPLTGAIVVTTPEDVALEDVRKGVRMFTDHGTPILGVVENMSGFTCSNCGDHHEIYGSGGGRKIADEYDIPLLGEIPIDPEIRAGTDTDGPVAALKDGPTAESFADFAGGVANRVGAVNRAEVAGVDPDDPESPTEPPADWYLEATGAEGTDDSESDPTADGTETEVDSEESVEESVDEQADESTDDTDDDETTAKPSGGLDLSDDSA